MPYFARTALASFSPSTFFPESSRPEIFFETLASRNSGLMPALPRCDRAVAAVHRAEEADPVVRFVGFGARPLQPLRHPDHGDRLGLRTRKRGDVHGPLRAGFARGDAHRAQQHAVLRIIEQRLAAFVVGLGHGEHLPRRVAGIARGAEFGNHAAQHRGGRVGRLRHRHAVARRHVGGDDAGAAGTGHHRHALRERLAGGGEEFRVFHQRLVVVHRNEAGAIEERAERRAEPAIEPVCERAAAAPSSLTPSL